VYAGVAAETIDRKGSHIQFVSGIGNDDFSRLEAAATTIPDAEIKVRGLSDATCNGDEMFLTLAVGTRQFKLHTANLRAIDLLRWRFLRPPNSGSLPCTQ
jgi:hypothetical protein